MELSASSDGVKMYGWQTGASEVIATSGILLYIEENNRSLHNGPMNLIRMGRPHVRKARNEPCGDSFENVAVVLLM